MRFLILTRRKLTVLAVCLTACAAASLASACWIRGTSAPKETAAAAAASQKKLPVYSVGTAEKKIAVSFDAAWGNEQTETLLEILGSRRVQTTFFVVGDWAEKYPESVKAIHAAGHEVCNHSDTHPHMPGLTPAQQAAELQNCNEKIAAVTGETPTLFRPPYGDYDNTVIESAEKMGMTAVQWDVDSLDWQDPTVEQMTERVLSKVANGSIVLFHNGAKNTPAALPGILDALQERGYEIVPVSQLLLKENYTIDVTGRQIPKGE